MVTIARIKDATRVFGEDQEEYRQLPIRDEYVDGVPAMTSAWELTPRDILTLKAGGKLYITIMGSVHPPMMVKVENRS